MEASTSWSTEGNPLSPAEEGAAVGIEPLIAAWNGFAVLCRHDRPTGTWIFVALHDASLGPPTGGTRLKQYPTPAEGLRDAMRLAEGMTRKWAAIEGKKGGGKAVLAVPRPLEGAEREGLLRRYGRLLAALGGAFRTGPDLGTTAGDMAVLAEETRWIHGVDRAAGRLVDSGPYTARGVLACIRAAVRHALGGGLAGRTVLVEGLGGVGAPLARLLAADGARLLLADLDPARAGALAAELGGAAVAAEEVCGTPCDVYAPCAVGAVLNRATIPHLACRVVAGAANNQLARDGDADLLHERGILYAPDYVVNAGGAIALPMLDDGAAEAEVLGRLEALGDLLASLLAEAAAAGEPPLRAAERRVERVLAGAGAV